ncbi:MAG: FAD-dependent oxidoreductase [Sandaracinaceae bacterium]|nr:FAD-dependent oxidoreductase [Sandaracinaceae bacterium]
MDRVEYLIVGAGMSGLAVADRLGRDRSYLVLEADTEVGGYCKTIRQDGFVWDYSGHFFHFRHPEIEAELTGRMREQRVLKVVKDSRIYYAGKMVDFPFQKNIHQLPHDEFLECLHDLYFRSADVPTSFLEMLYAKFGRAISEKFLIPYNEKLYATDLGTLDVDAMGRFFPHAELDEIIAGFLKRDNSSYNATFTYPEGGAIQYVHALMSGVDESRVSLGERLLEVDLQAKVARTNRRSVRFEHLVSSAPFDVLLRAAGVAFDPAVYSYNQVEVWNLGFDRKGPEGHHWVYFPQRDIAFYRVGFYDNIFGSDRMSLYVELGRKATENVDAHVAEQSLAAVLRDLERVGFVAGHKLVSKHHVVMNPAYVHITVDSLRDVAEKKALLRERGVHSIGRYGSWTYCSIEDNIVEARALVDELVGRPRD